MFFERGSDMTQGVVGTWYALNMSLDPEMNGKPLRPFNFLPDKYPAGTPGGAKLDWRVTRLTNLRNTVRLPLVFDGVWMFNDDPNRINARHAGNTCTNLLFADFHGETQLTSTLPNDDWIMQ